MKKILFYMFCASVAFSMPAQAKSIAMPGSGACTVKETVTLGVSFNRKVKSFGEAKALFDDHMKKIEEMAKQQQLKKFFLQNQNYNISSNPSSYGPDGTPDAYNYNMNGSMSYQLDNADAAFKFAEFLTQQKMQVNISSNSYRHGNCNDAQVAD